MPHLPLISLLMMLSYGEKPWATIMTQGIWTKLPLKGYYRPLTSTQTSLCISRRVQGFEPGGMTMTKYYNRFMELSQYIQAGGTNTSYLISKFTTHSQLAIRDKMLIHCLDTLVDWYVIALLVENSIKMRYQEH